MVDLTPDKKIECFTKIDQNYKNLYEVKGLQQNK
jgi:hypothetical protein